MENFSFLPYLLIIISVLTGVGGITLLIIGLVQNKRNLWLPGAIVFFVAFIFGIAGIIISVRSIVVNISENIGNIANIGKIGKHTSYIYTDSLSGTDSPVDSTFAESISGFIEDTDNSLIFIKVFPKKDLIAYGITLEKVNKEKKSQINNKAISLMLNFERGYIGKMKLTIFDNEKKVLGISNADVNKKPGEIGNINFLFSEDVNISIIDFCKLTIE